MRKYLTLVIEDKRAGLYVLIPTRRVVSGPFANS
jgi:hypothetical protein